MYPIQSRNTPHLWQKRDVINADQPSHSTILVKSISLSLPQCNDDPFDYGSVGIHFQTNKKQSTFDIDMPSFWLPVDESILLACSKLAISSSKFAAAAINSSVPVPLSRTTLLLAPMSDDRTCGVIIGRTDSRFPWISQLSIPLSGTA